MIRAFKGLSPTIAPGAYIGAFAAINARASICIATIVNTAAIVEHGVKVGVCVHLAPRSTLVRIATGRDHREAMPVSGIRLGQTEEQLAMSATVEQ